MILQENICSVWIFYFFILCVCFLNHNVVYNEEQTDDSESHSELLDVKTIKTASWKGLNLFPQIPEMPTIKDRLCFRFEL